MLARWSSASFWVRRFFSCLAHVIASFGSPVQAVGGAEQRWKGRENAAAVGTAAGFSRTFSADEGRNRGIRKRGAQEKQRAGLGRWGAGPLLVRGGGGHGPLRGPAVR